MTKSRPSSGQLHARNRKLASGVSILTILALSAVGGCAKSEGAAPPEEVIASWTAIACADATVRRVENIEPTPDVLARAVCEIEGVGTRTERGQVIQVFSSEAALQTGIASAGCGDGYFRVAGPNWLARTLVSEFATGFQEQMGGSLIC